MTAETHPNIPGQLDLSADIRFEPGACRCYVIDVSIGCSHNCTYCLFSQVEVKAHRLRHPEYRGRVLPLDLTRFLEREAFPSAVYMCYSSDPLGGADAKANTLTILTRLFEHNVSVLFITKGAIDDDVLEMFSRRPDLMNVQVGLTSADEQRNRYFEPGTPTYNERLQGLAELAKTPDLRSLVLRMDPLIPDVDDTEENLNTVMAAAKEVGAQEVTTGYVVLNASLQKAWQRHPYGQEALKSLTEATPTISGELVYSLPYDDKLARLRRIADIAASLDLRMAVCGCKDERLKATELEWICHPFNRARREELRASSDADLFNTSVDHLA